MELSFSTDAHPDSFWFFIVAILPLIPFFVFVFGLLSSRFLSLFARTSRVLLVKHHERVVARVWRSHDGTFLWAEDGLKDRIPLRTNGTTDTGIRWEPFKRDPYKAALHPGDWFDKLHLLFGKPTVLIIMHDGVILKCRAFRAFGGKWYVDIYRQPVRLEPLGLVDGPDYIRSWVPYAGNPMA